MNCQPNCDQDADGSQSELCEALFDYLMDRLVASYSESDRTAIERGIRQDVDNDSIPSDDTPMRQIVRGWLEQGKRMR
jgi:hypothetical protein